MPITSEELHEHLAETAPEVPEVPAHASIVESGELRESRPRHGIAGVVDYMHDRRNRHVLPTLERPRAAPEIPRGHVDTNDRRVGSEQEFATNWRADILHHAREDRPLHEILKDRDSGSRDGGRY